MPEPITIDDVKQETWMVTDDDRDTYLESLITPARAFVERYTGYSFIEAERTASFNAWGSFLEIARRPIASIESITYSTTNDPADDVELEDYIAPLGRYPFRIYPYATFPALVDGGTITVTYTTGVLPTTSEEYVIGRRAMLLVVRFWFDHPDEAGDDEAIPMPIRMLLDTITPISAY